MGVTIAFWLLATVCVASALAVVLLRDIFRAALFLILCFFTVAGIYVILSADFLAAVQILIYIGAISVLLIFAIMLTQGTQQGSPSGRLRVPALIVGLLLLTTIILTVVNTPWQVAELPVHGATTADIATRLFSQGGFILPFEIAAVLLLAATIGAIVLLREK